METSLFKIGVANTSKRLMSVRTLDCNYSVTSCKVFQKEKLVFRNLMLNLAITLYQKLLALYLFTNKLFQFLLV